MARCTSVRLASWAWHGQGYREVIHKRGFVSAQVSWLERHSPLIQGGPMVSISQVSSVLCGMVLLLNASHAVAQAPNELTRIGRSRVM